MEIKILTNYNDDDLWCADCKQKIRLAEKFGIVYEELYDGEIIEKTFHLDCLPDSNDWDIYLTNE